MVDNNAGAADQAKPRSWSKFIIFGVPLAGAAAFFAAGIVFWGGFNTAMEATNTLNFCISCHEMRDTVFEEYRTTIHYQNRTGVRATCSDCHVPDPWVHKVVRKVQASRELYYKALGSIDTPEKFEAKRLTLAKRVWATMKETDSRECRNCHNFQSMNPEFQRPRARKQHMNAFASGQTCIDCHKGIAHKNIRHLLPEDELEALEKPLEEFARAIPVEFQQGMERIEAKETAAAAEAEAETKAAEVAVKSRIDAAVAAALAAVEDARKTAGESETTSAAAAPSAQTGSTSGFDWSGIEAQTVTLFYPGQASYEWVLTGKDHGGARAFKRGGDRCAECHLNELRDMGAKIVSGEKVEPTPIPGKRPHIDVQVQAAHDGSNLYMRFQWPGTEHTPAPFASGGKMDPDNQVKLAMMIAGEGIDKADQAGCWLTCHNDSRYMPDAPDPADAAANEAAGRINVTDGITKYLPDSRTKIEVRGRGGKPKGGWDKLKPAEEVAGLLNNGAYMDLVRYLSGGSSENGHVLDQRVMTGGEPVSFDGGEDGGTWAVVLTRPLTASKPGDLAIESGRLYTVGFAIHDDYTSARFHHVSLEMRLGLDNPDAEINARKR